MLKGASVAQLVIEKPSRSRVFERFGIDYACNGRATLEEACQERDLLPAEVAAALEAAPDHGDVDCRGMGVPELVLHLESTHNALLIKELPRLLKLAQQVAIKHAAKQPELLEVQGLVGHLNQELYAHLAAEKAVLFPAIRGLRPDASLGERAELLQQPIQFLEDEHRLIALDLCRLRELTLGFTAPALACESWRALVDDLANLDHELRQHIHKENNLLFPAALQLP